MYHIVEVPIFRSVTVLHLGSEAEYKRFSGSYFVKRGAADSAEEKHIVIYVSYDPDGSYADSDGTYGRCWVVVLNNTVTGDWITYIIRNWIDLVKYYESFGYAFCNVCARDE